MVDPQQAVWNQGFECPFKGVPVVGMVLEVVATTDGRDAERQQYAQVEVFELFGGHAGRESCGRVVDSFLVTGQSQRGVAVLLTFGSSALV